MRRAFTSVSARPAVTVGDVLRVRGHFLPVGGILRARGRDCCPRRRRMPPPGATRTRPRRMSPWVVRVGYDGEVPDDAVMIGDVLRVRGHFLPAGDVLRVGGRDCCPRRRRMPPAGRTRTRPRGMSPWAGRRETGWCEAGREAGRLRAGHFSRSPTEILSGPREMPGSVGRECQREVSRPGPRRPPSWPPPAPGPGGRHP